MAYLRISRHYIHTAVLLFAGAEGLLLVLAPFLGYYFRFGDWAPVSGLIIPAIVFAAVLVGSMLAMGVYESRIRDGFAGMMLRTAVAVFLLGAMATALLSYVVPTIAIGRGVLLLTTMTAFVLLALWRWLTWELLSEDVFRRRVLVLGTGPRASRIASRMRRRADQRAFRLIGFVDLGAGSAHNEVAAYDARTLEVDGPLADFCSDHGVHEIVVAVDERRRNQDAAGGIPLDDLMECRLRGIEVCDVQQFIEREGRKIDIDLLRPSWMVFSDGFVSNGWQARTKRTFDVAASLLLLLVTWPIMLLAALAIWIEGRFREPVLYLQERVGLNGNLFNIMKFRSMSVDAEQAGEAVWASQNDPRITRVGGVLRKTRIDELPQLFNVLRGDMSFVGPRPERPVFVDELNEKIPYYDQRHRVKPGITGWAQLCYPYGASVEDAKQKLQYDLYYLKNHSLLLDLIILLQTVEVVLVGDGAR
ncbi:MAG: TIGR03013 family PEP-CTERM/XrtA system glycosyltransferase [Roseibium album]|uniref:TIGR03013 family XrtA/PEP-CTERM system glycosyltransferase n=1 Tax=Roseibium album TaxID=311410 RepID=UPI0032F052C7